jgi:hypothetical protein
MTTANIAAARIVSAKSGNAFASGLLLNYGNGESFVAVSEIKVWAKCTTIEHCPYFDKLRTVSISVTDGMFQSPNLICVVCLSQMYVMMEDVHDVISALQNSVKEKAS